MDATVNSPAIDLARDVRPLIRVLDLPRDDDLVLLGRPGTLVDVGVQVVVVPLATLLAKAAVQEGRDVRPLLAPELGDESLEPLVLLFAPCRSTARQRVSAAMVTEGCRDENSHGNIGLVSRLA